MARISRPLGPLLIVASEGRQWPHRTRAIWHLFFDPTNISWDHQLTAQAYQPYLQHVQGPPAHEAIPKAPSRTDQRSPTAASRRPKVDSLDLAPP